MRSDNAAFEAFVGSVGSPGFGLQAAVPAAPAEPTAAAAVAPPPPAPAPAPPPIQGLRLDRVPPATDPVSVTGALAALCLLALALAGGVWRGSRADRVTSTFRPTPFPLQTA